MLRTGKGSAVITARKEWTISQLRSAAVGRSLSDQLDVPLLAQHLRVIEPHLYRHVARVARYMTAVVCAHAADGRVAEWYTNTI